MTKEFQNNFSLGPILSTRQAHFIFYYIETILVGRGINHGLHT